MRGEPPLPTVAMTSLFSDWLSRLQVERGFAWMCDNTCEWPGQACVATRQLGGHKPHTLPALQPLLRSVSTQDWSYAGPILVNSSRGFPSASVMLWSQQLPQLTRKRAIEP